MQFLECIKLYYAIKLKNKEHLIIDEFKFKCSIGKKGLKSKKTEGDNCTPIESLILVKSTIDQIE